MNTYDYEETKYNILSKAVQVENGCLLIPWWVDNGINNYPYIRWHKVRTRVSRFMLVGNSRVGYFVRHRCHNRKCINPAHLWLGSSIDNLLDNRFDPLTMPYIHHPLSRLEENHSEDKLNLLYSYFDFYKYIADEVDRRNNELKKWGNPLVDRNGDYIEAAS